MVNFEFYSPTRFFFGKEQHKNVGKILKEYGAKKILLLYYGQPYEETLIGEITAALDEAGIAYVKFSGIKANPTYERAVEGTRIVKEEGIDFLLAVGGGSVIDTAKFIGVDALVEGDLWDYCYLRGNIADKTLPVGTILTIAATGSESSASSIITRDNLKKNMGGDLIRPTFSILNPELTYTLPPYQTASGIVDMIAHLHERYFTNAPENTLTDELSEGVFRTIIKYAPIVMKDPKNYEARAALMWSGTIAHNETCGVGRIPDLAVHLIQHPISAFFNSAHGAGCGVITLGWMKYVYKHDMARFVRYFTRVWGVDNDEFHPENVILAGIEKQKKFYESLGMPTTLEGVGMHEEDIDKLTATVDTFPHGKTGNFVMLDREDIKNIYRLCLEKNA